MKVLVIGSGVIGTTYAWQLSESGSDVSLYVRREKSDKIKDEGIVINCTDLRGNIKKETQVLYKPKIVSEISESENYELIIVPVNSNQVGSILPVLREYKGKADILFFHNKWTENEEIEKYLNSSQYLFGFPFKAGGGSRENKIDTVIFGESICRTMLGEKDGSASERVRKIEKLMKKANMNPKVTDNIMGWLWTHYVWGVCNIGAYIKSGSYDKFAHDTNMIKECYLAMREGFEVCRMRGADARSIYPVKLFYIPLLVLTPYTKLLYKKDGMKKMFEGHVLHSPGEMKAMYYDVLEAGKKYGISMPYYEGFKKYIDEYYDKLKW